MNTLLKAAAAAAVASVALAGSANAAIDFGFIPGGDAPIASDTLLYDFSDGNLGVLDAGYDPTKVIIQSATNSNGAQNPFSIPGGNYLSILANGSATITFDHLLKSVSFNWGSVDAYNVLTIHWSGGDETVVGNPGGGDQQNPSNNGVFWANVGSGEYISGLTFASSQNSFEIDDISGSAVPEPATWAMMIAGFGLAGAALRRRRTIFAAA